MGYRIHTDIPDEARREAYKQIYKTCNLSQRDKDDLMDIASLIDTPRGTPEERLRKTTETAQQLADMRNAGPRVAEFAAKAEKLTQELEPKIRKYRESKGML